MAARRVSSSASRVEPPATVMCRRCVCAADTVRGCRCSGRVSGWVGAGDGRGRGRRTQQHDARLRAERHQRGWCLQVDEALAHGRLRGREEAHRATDSARHSCQPPPGGVGQAVLAAAAVLVAPQEAMCSGFASYRRISRSRLDLLLMREGAKGATGSEWWCSAEVLGVASAPQRGRQPVRQPVRQAAVVT